MSRIEVSVDIGASPEVVWDFVSNLRRIPEWIEDTLAMLTVEPEPAQQGTVYRERSRIVGPLSQVTTWKITEFDPPRFQKHDGQVRMMAATSVSFGLEPSAGRADRQDQVHAGLRVHAWQPGVLPGRPALLEEEPPDRLPALAPEPEKAC